MSPPNLRGAEGTATGNDEVGEIHGMALGARIAGKGLTALPCETRTWAQDASG